MDQILQDKVDEATKLDKEWTPSIYMPSDDKNNFVDIVSRLKPSQVDLTNCSYMGYPSGASFHFFGFKGEEDTVRLKETLVRAAKVSGTELTVRNRGRPSNLRTLTLEFSCVKHHKTKTASSKTFNDACIQQCSTIIQPKHQGASIKGSSRS